MKQGRAGAPCRLAIPCALSLEHRELVMAVSALAARLPAADVVSRWSRSLAMLDAILSPDPQYRYFSFNNSWDDGEQLAAMSNGSGDEYSITFTGSGTYIRGFDHESELSPF